MILTLHPMEIRIAELVGKVRHEMNRKNGIPNRQRGPQDPLFIDINGVAGELASGRYLNVYPDFTGKRLSSGTGGSMTIMGWSMSTRNARHITRTGQKSLIGFDRQGEQGTRKPEAGACEETQQVTGEALCQ